uniref:Malate synthase n=1 Tax=Aegilops tauschii TaxID=37682 RepID=M8C272_AEGTA
MAQCYDTPEGVDIRGRYDPEFAAILTRDALAFVAGLQREFRGAVRFVREGEWACAPVPPAIADRTVEITGPADPRKMVINALNSGAKVFMADFEDALAPTWENLMRGQVNLRDAVAGTISFRDAARGGRVYKLDERTAKLFVRPRGWHLPEAHVLIDGEPAIGCLVDFGLYFFHSHAAFRAGQGAGFGPFFYLPKMEHSREARIWNGVFERAERVAGIERGSIRATVLVETLPAVFQMDEILHELRDHSAGLNCGRWDYIFSYVKTFRAHPDRLLPDRALVGMAQHFMRSYSHLLIRTCHRRRVHAMGGMAAQIPIKDDAAANEAALELVRGDKLREYLAAWLGGSGSVPLYNLMEDAATAEISRVQNWQWLHHGAVLDAGGVAVRATPELLAHVGEEEMARVQEEVGADRFRRGRYKEAGRIFIRQCVAPELDDFLTLDAYGLIVVHHPRGAASKL